MFIATLIAADRLAEGDISAAEDALAGAGAEAIGRAWLEQGVAADIRFTERAAEARAAIEAIGGRYDVVVQPAATRAKQLLVADMDSTMITVECLDELADHAGLRDRVAAITERAMLGELDFAAALDERVAMIAGLEEAVLTRCHDERIAASAGAETLVRTMRARGARTVLVSGGFSHFVDRVARELGFDRAVSNRLHIEQGVLTGKVSRPIVDAEAKRAVLEEERAALGLDAALTLAIGDGANDIPMIEAAGLGIAYRAKPKAREAADARLDHADLTALLYAQGIGRAEWVSG